ncbi:MAG: beta-ketoacyl synthase N-terminal-like domain-containing protein [Gammaproteobacteria bacterium]
MRRAVITGYGGISCLGNDITSIADSLQNLRSGIKKDPSYQEQNMRCRVSGGIDLDVKPLIERKKLRFMSRATAYAYLAAEAAIAQSKLTPEMLNSEKTATFVGTGGNGIRETHQALDIWRLKGARKIPPYVVPQTMDNGASAVLSTYFKTRGASYSISSACSTSAHCIGQACEQIQLNNADLVLAGGADDECWQISSLFDAMGALSSHFNDYPEQASRPFDKERDGFVPSGGAGIVIVEELEHALSRNATIFAEIVGYGATSDGVDMVAPSGEGAERCMRMALRNCDAPDYINAHATSTPAGDHVELQAIRQVLGSKIPDISSTKALTGHALGGAGVLELIYSLIMLERDFIVPCVNLTTPDDVSADFVFPTEVKNQAGLKRIMSNSFGFGGTNASLVIEKHSS